MPRPDAADDRGACTIGNRTQEVTSEHDDADDRGAYTIGNRTQQITYERAEVCVCTTDKEDAADVRACRGLAMMRTIEVRVRY